MKVTSTSALPLVLLVVVCASASPMFGTGGMMKRKFPGAADMSYRTYREIANSNARGDTSSSAAAASNVATRAGGAAVVPRTGGSGASDSSWMFGNGLAAPSSLSSSQSGSFSQQGLPFYPQSMDAQVPFEGRYPSVWDPRDSYHFLQFPYHAPAPLDYEVDYLPQNKIYRNYY